MRRRLLSGFVSFSFGSMLIFCLSGMVWAQTSAQWATPVDLGANVNTTAFDG